VDGGDWFVASVLFAFEFATGVVTPAAGEGGDNWIGALAGTGAGAAPALWWTPWPACWFGMYSGPVWPQPDKAVISARLVSSAQGVGSGVSSEAGNANEDFTIRIRV
jgi:hypothetical protein